MAYLLWIYHILLVIAFAVLFVSWALEARRARSLSVIAEGLALQGALSGLTPVAVDGVARLLDALEVKDPVTSGHVFRVQEHAEAIARELHLSPEQTECVAMAGKLHDIGKIGTPDHILLKPGKLTAEEYQVVQQHAPRGHRIASRVSMLRRVREIIRAHHERFDGAGYPDGRRGEEIPIEARIIAVADTFDAMTSDRPYKGALSVEAVLDELRRVAGSQLDPQCVAAFERIASRRGAFQIGPAGGSGPEPAAFAGLQFTRPGDDAAPHDFAPGGRQRDQGEPASVVAPVFLLVTLIAFGDLAEIVPAFAPVVAEPWFIFFHETHDLLALVVALYAANRWAPKIGIYTITWFTALHLPYLFFSSPDDLPELVRLVSLSITALFGIHLIKQRLHAEDRVAKIACLDPLTGVFNHRYLFEVLDHALGSMRHNGRRGVLLFLDLDGFKKVNDRLGHQAGDLVLRTVATLLMSQTRERDLVARLGGDEFVIVLMDVNMEEAQSVIHRLLQGIRTNHIAAGQERVTITASIGAVTFPDGIQTVDGLLAAADSAMYDAKSDGGDRFRFHGDPHLVSDAVAANTK